MKHLRHTAVIAMLLVPSMPAAGVAAGCENLSLDGAPLVTRRPVRGEQVRLAAGFGPRRHPILAVQRLHAGVDWAAPLGTPVSAAGKGRVVSAGHEGAYGNRVIIDHGGGWQTVYAQLSRFSVSVGDCVDASTAIGTIGSTGLSTGPHLHFEVRHGDQPVDPMRVPVKAEN